MGFEPCVTHHIMVGVLIFGEGYCEFCPATSVQDVFEMIYFAILTLMLAVFLGVDYCFSMLASHILCLHYLSLFCIYVVQQVS